MNRSAKTKPTNKALIDVRNLPLERFRMAKDGRKWKQVARSRFAVLEFIASFANGDGKVGKYSPGIQRQVKRHGLSDTWLYRLHDDLNELGFLSWERERKGHHNQRREYIITIPDAVPNAVPDGGAPELFEGEHLNYSDSEQVNYSQEHLNYSSEHLNSRVGEHLNSRVGTSVSFPSEEPSKERETLSSNLEQNGSASRTDMEQVAHDYFVWLFLTYDGLSFGVKNKAAIREFIVGSNYSLDTLKKATARILADLDLKDPFTHADNRLVGSLPESCVAAIQNAEEAKRKDAIMTWQVEQQMERLRQQADTEAAELQKKLADEAELTRDTLALSV